MDVNKVLIKNKIRSVEGYMNFRYEVWILALGVFCFGKPSIAATAQVLASKDNTLYEDALGTLSNGAGDYLFSGTTNGSSKRRTLIAFDVAAAVPPGSVITDAVLKLYMSKTTSGASDQHLFRLTANWGESTSDAMENEGQGAAAVTGDATWTSRFFGSLSSNWATPGGDFASTESASTSVADIGFYTWQAPGLLNDVKGWLTAPTTNFGWIVIGNEAASTTAKRYDSRTNPVAGNRPVLTITYTPASAVTNWTLY